MSWQDKYHSNNFNKRKVNAKTNDSKLPVCKEFGCNKVLTPNESLLSDYCFTHQLAINQADRAKYKMQDLNVYKAVLFRWNAVNHVWDKIKVMIITLDQFSTKINSEDYKEENGFYYRYDLFLDFQCTDSIYSYSPVKFD